MYVAGVAQLVRASGCGPEGRGFKSLHSPQNIPVGCFVDTSEASPKLPKFRKVLTKHCRTLRLLIYALRNRFNSIQDEEDRFTGSLIAGFIVRT